MLKKAVLALLALCILMPTSTAEAQVSGPCPFGNYGWYIHGPDQVMQCARTHNHVAVNWWVGGGNAGLVLESWIPPWLHWFAQPYFHHSNPYYRSEFVFCYNGNDPSPNAPGDPAYVRLVTSGSPGWETAFQLVYTSGYTVTAGELNHWLGHSGKPYDNRDTYDFNTNCAAVGGYT